MKCNKKGCTHKVSGKDSWYCERHEYEKYVGVFTKSLVPTQESVNES